ncbi:MAG TPA: phage baseplate assembly protein V [Polyangiaceae bacterium]|nr:phage baseplate assembly protein V [Polyangiaceae bacterium]
MRVQGVVTGLVSNVDDPLKQHRIKVRFPWLDDGFETDWIRIASFMAGAGRGAYFMPEPDDEVLVAFEHGHQNVPYVIGFLHNGRDPIPGVAVGERIIRSVNGHSIRFLDSTPENGDRGALVIEDGHGNRITLSNGKVTIKSVAVLQIDAPSIVLGGPGYRRVIAPNNNPI